MADYAWKMTAQSWSDDSYYVGSSMPVKEVEVVASTQPEAIEEAARMLGSAGQHRHWKFFGISARDVRLVKEVEHGE
jgi:hypothetical protein